MGQYNFIQPDSGPSWTQGLAGGIGTAISMIRQKQRDRQDQSNKDRDFGLRKSGQEFDQGEAQRRDIEQGWSPATGTNAGGVPQTSTPKDPMPGSYDVPSADQQDFANAPSGGAPNLAAAIGQVRSQRAAAPSMPQEPAAGDWASEIGGGAVDHPDDLELPSPSHTTSGQPADPRVGALPTSGDVHFGGMVFNPSSTPAARQSMMAAEIQRQREIRERGYAAADRTRKTGELTGAGVSGGRASAIADNALPYNDATDDPQHFGNVQRASDIDLGRGLALERERRKTAIATHSLEHADETDRSIDRYTDDAQKDVGMAQAALGVLQKKDTALMDADQMRQHTAEIAAAQEELNTAKGRYSHYQGIVDQRIDHASGAKPRSGPASKKTPTTSQIDRAAKDPDYRQYLTEQGYDMSDKGVGGRFMSPFKFK